MALSRADWAHSAGANGWPVRRRLLHRRSIYPGDRSQADAAAPLHLRRRFALSRCRHHLCADAAAAHRYRSQNRVFRDNAGWRCRDGERCCPLRWRIRTDHGGADVARGIHGDSGSVLYRAFRKYRDTASACSGRDDVLADARHAGRGSNDCGKHARAAVGFPTADFSAQSSAPRCVWRARCHRRADAGHITNHGPSGDGSRSVLRSAKNFSPSCSA